MLLVPDLRTVELLENKEKSGKTRFVYSGSPNQIVRFSQLSLWLTTRKVQTSLCSFSPTIVSNCTCSNLGCRQQNKKRPEGRYLFWQPQPDSNWCSRLERAVSWASRRWGQNCRVSYSKRCQIITGFIPIVKAF